MSVAAETSRTAFEIYQPVIVGLGAVVLGLFANACLEWWKSNLTERRNLATMRRAILIEMINLDTTYSNTERFFDTHLELDHFPLPLSQWIMDLDRKEIGILSTEEVQAIAELITTMKGMMSLVLVDQGNQRLADIYMMKSASLSNDAVCDSFRVAVSQLASEARSARKIIEERLVA